MKQILFSLFFVCNILGACMSTSSKNALLEIALEESGINRVELEKVLRHYAASPRDSLKLQAAEFLIRNMPGHYTLEGELVNLYHKELAKTSSVSYFTKKMFDLSLKNKEEIIRNSCKKEDLFYIKADYFIHHIDNAFLLLRKCPWLQYLPFEDFLEYILPYRLENENLDYWLDSLRIQEKVIHEIKYKDNIKNSVIEIERYMDLMPKPLYDERLITSIIYTNCYDEARKYVFIRRAMGIPAAIDFIPCYPNRNGYHHWKTIISPGIKYREIGHLYTHKAAKIYRRTFSHNKIVEPAEGEYVPEFFLDPFNKDVTDYYFNTQDVTINLGKLPSKILHVYLCVFNNLKWEPVAIAKVEKGKALFKNMGKDIVYLPAYYEKGMLRGVSVPFILSLNGSIKYYIPDTDALLNLHLTRKYPFNKYLYKFSEELDGARIIATNDDNFKQFDTIGILSSENMHYFLLDFQASKSYRYWNVIGKEFTPLNIAELIFEDSLQQRIPFAKVNPEYGQAFDKDPLTSITIHARRATLSVDFGKPVYVSRIVVLPRGDGNGIYPGNLYELFYWDNGCWNSLGKCEPKDYYLDYTNVPRNALLWLRNLTTGIQERIFSWDGEEVSYW